MLKRRNVLLVSLIAMFAVASARADIASTGYVDDALSYKVNSADLKTVATTGSYTDLSNKPDIQGIESDLDAVWDTENDNSLVNRVSSVEKALGETGKTDAGKAVIAGNSLGTPTYRAIDTTAGGTNGSDSLITSDAVFDGLAGKQNTIDASHKLSYSYISGTPTNVSDFTNDAGYITSADVAGGQVQADWTETDDNDPAYIKHKPTKVSDFTNDTGFITSASLPTKVSDLTNDTGFVTASDQVQPNWNATSGKGQILNKPTLATVATSGSYTDLSNTPTAVSDFTNDAGYITSAALPTKVSDLTNDAGYVTASAQVQPDWNATSGKGQILNKPTKVSDFTNDAGYITSAALPTKVSDLTNDAGYLSSHQTLPTVTTSTGSGNVVTNVTQTNGAIAVTKGRVQIPVGSETANNYASIWVE